MHTVFVVGGGFALMVACLLLGHAWGGGMKGLATGAQVFIGSWFVAATINMWIGVSRAGYSVAEEAPIFLGIFGVPAAIAAFVAWKMA